MGTLSHDPFRDQPFGHFALPAARERIRRKASQYSNSQWGRWMISACRKRAIKGLSEPFDIDVAPDVKARLYPAGNRCEKRALAGVQIWDAAERQALKDAISEDTTCFTFLDVGANVGLYSLFVNAYAKEFGRPVRMIAVEPSDAMAARLRINAAASDASVEIVSSAISDAPGQAYLSDGAGNFGEASLSDKGVPVQIETLLGLCERLGVRRIDAMKLDIEGHDERALTGFFKDAADALHPHLLIVETDPQNSPLIELARKQNYVVADATALNAILKKR